MAVNPIQFLLADVATATNGSDTITIQGTVTTNTNASSVFSGSAVFVGNNQVVEGIAGTAFNPATNTSTITLRNAWPHATVSGRLVVFNTIEGLGDAIRRARESAQSTSEIQTAYGDVLTSTDATIDIDINGVSTAIVPYGFLQGQVTALVNTGATVVDDITAVEARVGVVETDLDAIEGTLNGLVADAQAAEAAAELAETNINASLVTFNADLGTFNTNFASFNTDFGTFGTNYAQFQTDFGTFGTNFTAFNTDFGTFNTDYAQFVTDFATIAGSVSAASTSEANAAASATESQNASSISQSNANYVGDWVDQTGALNIPASLRHNNAVWQLAVNLPDVTASEPSATNTDWFLISNIGTTALDSERLGGELPAFYATASSVSNVDNTSDANKPVSTAAQTALDLKADGSTTVNGNPLSADITLTASDVGADTVQTLDNPQTQTLSRVARKTILNVVSGTNTFTVDSSLYSQGDQIEVNKLRQDTPTITTTLDEDNIIFPDGTNDTIVTQENSATFTITLTKRSDGDWDLIVRN